MLHDPFDSHLHTTRSVCGEDITDEWLTARARENGCTFAVTDHTMHLYYEPEIAWSMMTENGIQLFEERQASGRENIRRYLDDIRDCGASNMLAGVELDVLPDGQIMFPDDLRGELDILVGATHFLPTIKRKLGQDEVEAEFRRQTQWLLEYGVDALAHPFRIILGAGYAADDALVRWTVDLAAEHGTALEINSHKVFADHDVQMVKLAMAAGLRISLATDAHNTREFGDFSYHEDILRRSGLDAAAGEEILFRPDKK